MTFIPLSMTNSCALISPILDDIRVEFIRHGPADIDWCVAAGPDSNVGWKGYKNGTIIANIHTASFILLHCFLLHITPASLLCWHGGLVKKPAPEQLIREVSFPVHWRVVRRTEPLPWPYAALERATAPESTSCKKHHILSLSSINN